MKVTMKETFQGVGVTAVLLHENITVTILQEGESYVVDNVLGNWLIDNNKAEAYKDAPHYGAQDEPEYPRNDEENFKAQTETLTDETGIEQPVMSTPTAKKTRKSKGEK